MITYEITNIDLFTDVDLEGLKKTSNGYHGTVSIETDEGWKDFTGQHGANDYEDEFGFIIVSE